MTTSFAAPRAALSATVLLLATTTTAVAQSGYAVQSAYPKINLAVGYKVDPTWPQKPSGIHWRYVTGVAVDPQDRVWILNGVEPHVQVYGVDGKLLDSWSSSTFKSPHSLRLDRQGNVWTVDYESHVVEKYSPKGRLLLRIGTLGVPGCDATHFNRPTDVAVTPQGDVFVSDGYGNNRVVRFNAEGRFVKSWGTLGQGPGQLSQPHTISVDSRGILYVTERNNCRIQLFDQTGNSLGQWRNLINPWGLWITPRDEILVCGSTPVRWGTRPNLGNPPDDQIVIKFNPEGRALELQAFPLCKSGTQAPGTLDWVHGIAADSKGNLYLSDVADDSPSHRVQKFIRLPAERD